ncbi:MAG: pentapeptide repeat-containing protein [Pseudanabaenaceae cyanobacterium bins.39]|nr:pentapeptide repeat-containing protein [Pseudanabaenaceae cyanobacterium bins.39]
MQKRYFVLQLVIVFFLSVFSGFFTAYTGVVTTLFPAPYNIEILRIVPSMAMIIIFCSSIIQQGFTAKAFVMIAGALALVTFVFALLGTVALPILFGGGVVALALVILSWTFALSGALSFVGALAGSCYGALLSLFVGWFGAGSVSSALAGSVILASGTLLLSVYAARRALKGDRKFDRLLKFMVGFTSIGGTSFRGADLTNANFTKAYLKSSDFRNSPKQSTNLTRIIWNQAEKLDRSRLGTSILSNPEVRKLLVTGKPNQSKSYEGLNLRGANLDGVYLEGVNFKRAILSEASFCNANLEAVNFTEAQVIGTDFTGAQMTGACLDGWIYDHTTKLDDVE